MAYRLLRYLELYDADAAELGLVEAHLPKFTFLLEDLESYRDQEILARATSALGRLALLAMRHARDPRGIPSYFDEWALCSERCFTASARAS